MCATYNVLPLKLYYAQGPKDRKHTKLICKLSSHQVCYFQPAISFLLLQASPCAKSVLNTVNVWRLGVLL